MMFVFFAIFLVYFCLWSCFCISFDVLYFHFDNSHRNDRINIKVSFVVLIFQADRPENKTKLDTFKFIGTAAHQLGF